MTARHFALATDALEPGTTLLEASAGTGKTYTLTGLVLRLLLEGHVAGIAEVLVVTFTVAAAEELKTRLRDGLQRGLRACRGERGLDPFFSSLQRHGAGGAQKLERALAEFDQVSVSTIHGFCKRLLEEDAFASGTPFRTDFVDDEIPLLHASAEDALRRRLFSGERALAAVAHAVDIDAISLVRDFRLWQRYPDVRLQPAEVDLAGGQRRLAAALQGVVAAASGELHDRLASLRWSRKGSPFGSGGELAIAQFLALLRREPLFALDTVRALAADVLLGKKSPLLAKQGAKIDHPFFTACAAARGASDVLALQLRSDLLSELQRCLLRQKQRDHCLTFQDLLLATHAALTDQDRGEAMAGAVRQRFRAALIDEFQDTDPLQYAIFRQCFRGRQLFLVGDPKQSIYGFRGADLQAYLTARNQADDAATLATNFRSNQPLVDAVAHLFGRQQPFLAAEIGLPPVRANAAAGRLQLAGDPGPPLRWRFLPPKPTSKGVGTWAKPDHEPLVAADVVAEIVRLLGVARCDDRALSPGDIAVLTRTNRQAVLMQDQLRAAGVVSAIGKAGNIFDTDELTDIERLLTAVLQPRHLAAARAAFATRLWGLDAAAIARLDDDDDGLERELGRLDDWRRVWLRLGFVVMINRAFGELAMRTRLLPTPGGERRITNYLQIVELLHDAEHSARRSPEALLQWLQHERLHNSETDYQRRELRLESDEQAVQILTVHGSKGLEYDVVFCPFLAVGKHGFPPPYLATVGDHRELHFDDADGTLAAATSHDNLAEDLRLLYVAVTRARRRCYLHWGAMYNAQYSALSYLLVKDAAGVAHWQGALAALVAASGDSMGMSLLDAAPAPCRYTAAAPPQLGPARQARRKPVLQRLQSFTSLTAGDGGAGDGGADDGPQDRFDPPAAAVASGGSRGIFAFARGAIAGQCLHEILEHVPLAASETAASGTAAAAQRIQASLRRFGLDQPAAHAGAIDPLAVVQQNLRDLGAAVVPAAATTLAALTAGDRAAEWHFCLRAANAPLAALATAFERHGGGVAAGYAATLRELPYGRLHGFLTGVADLVAVHQGRYWLLDWKSNHLGDELADYAPPALAAAMTAHHYVLQYHLYALALHRQLRARLPDYDCERHFGGVCYVFLRGASAGSASGLFVDRPPRALIEAIDRWADGEVAR